MYIYIYRVEDRIGNGYTGRDSVLRGAGGGRVDRARVELNGNPVQSGGPNRERTGGRRGGPDGRTGPGAG